MRSGWMDRLTPRCLDVGKHDEWESGDESIADTIAEANDECAYLGVRAAEFRVPGEGQGAGSDGAVDEHVSCQTSAIDTPHRYESEDVPAN
jgi:hypothetical protein